MESTRMVSKSRMKRSNLRLIFQKIYENRSISRPQLASVTGLSVMSAGRLVDELLALHLVTDAENTEGPTQGRPAKLLRVDSDNLLSIGLFIDSDGIHAGVVDPYGQIIHVEKIPCQLSQLPVAETVDIAASIIKRLKEQYLATLPMVGICIPGLVDQRAGVVRFSTQLKWRNVNLLQLMVKKLGDENVIVENDIKAWALAEKQFGVARPYQNVALLSIGSGLGSAVVMNGSLYRGKHNLAGEIGHVVVNPSGRLCTCGKIGCLQTHVAEWAVLQEAALICPGATIDTMFEAYDSGAEWACEIIGRMVTYTDMAINLLVNAFAPDAVVLCGNMVEQYPVFRRLVDEHIRSHGSDFMADSYALFMSDFGTMGSVIGASAVAFQQTVNKMIV